MSDRWFAVDSHGETLLLNSVDAKLGNMGIAPEVSAAYDILTDDGVPAQRAAEFAVIAHQDYRSGRSSRTAEQFARHFVSLRHAAKGWLP